MAVELAHPEFDFILRPFDNDWARIDYPAQEFGADRSKYRPGGIHYGMDCEGDNMEIVAPYESRVFYTHSTGGGYGVEFHTGPIKGITWRFRCVHAQPWRPFQNGTWVKQGQVCAKSNNSGTFTSGPHGHIETYANTLVVNPRRVWPEIGADPRIDDEFFFSTAPTFRAIAGFWWPGKTDLEVLGEFGISAHVEYSRMLYPTLPDWAALACDVDNKVRQMLNFYSGTNLPFNTAWDHVGKDDLPVELKLAA